MTQFQIWCPRHHHNTILTDQIKIGYLQGRWMVWKYGGPGGGSFNAYYHFIIFNPKEYALFNFAFQSIYLFIETQTKNIFWNAIITFWGPVQIGHGHSNPIWNTSENGTGLASISAKICPLPPALPLRFRRPRAVACKWAGGIFLWLNLKWLLFVTFWQRTVCCKNKLNCGLFLHCGSYRR